MDNDDIFLKIDGGRQGPIKGSSTDSIHAGEIDVFGWGWGMQGNADAHTSRGGRTSVHEFEVIKGADSATTGLMSALRNNEPITKAVLTVRKASGATPLPYLIITLEKARVTSFRIEGGEIGGRPTAVEKVRFACQKICVEYKDQSAKGGAKGTSTFETSIAPGS